MNKEKITRKAFNSLSEYSCSLPTGQKIGKVWKKNINFGSGRPPEWRICEYIEHPDPNKIGIEYRIPEILE